MQDYLRKLLDRREAAAGSTKTWLKATAKAFANGLEPDDADDAIRAAGVTVEEFVALVAQIKRRAGLAEQLDKAKVAHEEYVRLDAEADAKHAAWLQLKEQHQAEIVAIYDRRAEQGSILDAARKATQELEKTCDPELIEREQRLTDALDKTRLDKYESEKSLRRMEAMPKNGTILFGGLLSYLAPGEIDQQKTEVARLTREEKRLFDELRACAAEKLIP